MMDVEIQEVNFVKEKIKGKIAEIIFQHMISKTGKAIVIPLGYENTIPTVAQFQQYLEKDTNKLLKRIRSLPDFIVTTPDNKKAILVEVHFRKDMVSKSPFSLAKDISKQWENCYMFLATLDGFFFDKCDEIILNKKYHLLRRS